MIIKRVEGNNFRYDIVKRTLDFYQADTGLNFGLSFSNSATLGKILNSLSLHFYICKLKE